MLKVIDFIMGRNIMTFQDMVIARGRGKSTVHGIRFKR